MKGVYLGFFLPARVLAASVAKRPSVLPLASSTNHLRVISCELGKYVDIVIVLQGTIVYRRMTYYRGKPRGWQLHSRKRKVLNRLSGEDQTKNLRFPGRLPGLAQSSESVGSEAALHFSRNRQRLQRAGRGTAQEDQTNAIGQGRQPVWGDNMRTKEAFPVHSGRHTLFLEYSGGFPPHDATCL